MVGTLSSAACHQYDLEISIAAPRDVVWDAIFNDINAWWLADFHVVGPDSVVSFDPTPGGKGLLESTPDGDVLQWYTVQMYLPTQFKVYLVGHIAPEWGGPTTSSLKLAVVESDDGCVLQITDARHGNVNEEQTKSFEEGWKSLFSDGLKKYIESK